MFSYTQCRISRNYDQKNPENKSLQTVPLYFSLTDEESKKNWEEYGNPDGPGGIVLVINKIVGKIRGHVYSKFSLSDICLQSLLLSFDCITYTCVIIMK